MQRGDLLLLLVFDTSGFGREIVIPAWIHEGFVMSRVMASITATMTTRVIVTISLACICLDQSHLLAHYDFGWPSSWNFHAMARECLLFFRVVYSESWYRSLAAYYRIISCCTLLVVCSNYWNPLFFIMYVLLAGRARCHDTPIVL
jgi:hypothetical protein